MEQEKKKIIREVERELFNPVKGTIGKTPTFIKNPLDRLDKIFNFQKEQYILLGSVTGAGKTSISDHFILSIIDSKPQDIHYEVLYYSMERKKKFKFAKWLSWKLKHNEDIRVSSNRIMNRDGNLTEEQLTHIGKYADWLNETMNHIDLREGPRTVQEIETDIDTLAMRLGTLFHTDAYHIYKNNKVIGKLPEDQFVLTRYGKRRFVRFLYKDIEYTLYQNDSVYITDKPTIVTIVIDHIGKVIVERDKKKTLDDLDRVLSTARDKYSFSPLAISQFNRGIGGTDRHKFHKGDLSPTLEDFKDTGSLTESADLVLSLFDPARYKSWDAQGDYSGINIRDNTVTPIGQQRARSLHILKNSFGYDNAKIMLRFTGESMYFETMPKYDDDKGLARMYNEIAKGK